jgi:hypothetical protein
MAKLSALQMKSRRALGQVEYLKARRDTSSPLYQQKNIMDLTSAS